MYKYILFLSLIAVVIASERTPVRKCKHFEHHQFKKVVIRTSKGVCSKLPCKFERGTNVTSDVTFEVKSKIKKIILKMNATVNGAIIDYPIPDGNDACKRLTNTVCPIKEHTEANLRYVFPIKDVFADVTLVTPYLLDQAHNVISCFQLPIRIV